MSVTVLVVANHSSFLAIFRTLHDLAGRVTCGTRTRTDIPVFPSELQPCRLAAAVLCKADRNADDSAVFEDHASTYETVDQGIGSIGQMADGRWQDGRWQDGRWQDMPGWQMAGWQMAGWQTADLVLSYSCDSR